MYYCIIKVKEVDREGAVRVYIIIFTDLSHKLKYNKMCDDYFLFIPHTIQFQFVIIIALIYRETCRHPQKKYIFII